MEATQRHLIGFAASLCCAALCSAQTPQSVPGWLYSTSANQVGDKTGKHAELRSQAQPKTKAAPARQLVFTINQKVNVPNMYAVSLAIHGDRFQCIRRCDVFIKWPDQSDFIRYDGQPLGQDLLNVEPAEAVVTLVQQAGPIEVAVELQNVGNSRFNFVADAMRWPLPLDPEPFAVQVQRLRGSR